VFLPHNGASAHKLAQTLTPAALTVETKFAMAIASLQRNYVVQTTHAQTKMETMSAQITNAAHSQISTAQSLILASQNIYAVLLIQPSTFV